MARKDFKSNPAMTFISQESIDKVDGKKKEESKKKTRTSTKARKTPAKYKPNPEYIETKSKRVQVLLQPSVHEAVKAKAKAEGISTNEAINIALKEYTER